MCPTYPARVALLYGSLAVLCSILSNTCRQEIAAAAWEQLSSGAGTNIVAVRYYIGTGIGLPTDFLANTISDSRACGRRVSLSCPVQGEPVFTSWPLGSTESSGPAAVWHYVISVHFRYYIHTATFEKTSTQQRRDPSRCQTPPLSACDTPAERHSLARVKCGHLKVVLLYDSPYNPILPALYALLCSSADR